MKLTQKNFTDFCKGQSEFAEALNHRMTNVEASVNKLKIDVSWIRNIGYYVCGLITTIAIKLLFF